MASKIIDLKTLTSSAAVILAVELGLHWAAWPKNISPLMLIGAARVLEGLSLLVLLKLLTEQGTASIGLRADSFTAGVKKGLIWSAGFGLLVLVAAMVLHLAAGVNAFELLQGGQPAARNRIWLLFLIGGIISPVTEEIFFRGILYGSLRKWGMLTAITGSTVLFVLAHAIQGTFPLTQVVGGLLFAVAYERERNLMVPIVIHMLGNLAIFTLTFL